VFSYTISYYISDHRGRANIDPWGMIITSYVVVHIQLCYMPNIRALKFHKISLKLAFSYIKREQQDIVCKTHLGLIYYKYRKNDPSETLSLYRNIKSTDPWGGANTDPRGKIHISVE
jgi:hypothetical protein